LVISLALFKVEKKFIDTLLECCISTEIELM